EGYPLETIDVSGLKGAGAGGLAQGLLRLPRAFSQSRRILKRYAPDVVVAVGGYSSGPMVMAAALRSLPTAIREQNRLPGVASPMRGKVARRAFIAFDASRRSFPSRKTVLAGNPIRSRLQVQTGQLRGGLLIVGGSQGAHALNELMVETIAQTA